ncbi:MAG: Hpt domain-containing protein [Deltaproteobacteria bacterium]|jgi:two-component system chemotaxis sensor kinase CheA|nr:Hpt domain-containing protein [Deltaproteobacteria bacterium]
MDMAKYRQVFIEESTEHLAEMSSALLKLEKNLADGEAIDLIFRMAHSIKGMAASLDYDSITQVSHGLEDRMQEIRREGSVADPDELALLFRGLDRLESMVNAIRSTGKMPPPDPDLAAVLTNRAADPPAEVSPSALAASASAQEAAKKKAHTPIL